MFIQRAILTITLGPLALLLIYLGGWYYFLPIVAVLVLATFEYNHMANQMGWPTSSWLLILMVLPVLLLMNFSSWAYIALTLVGGTFLAMVYALWLYEYKKDSKAPSAWIGMIGGLFLLGFIGGHFFWLRNLTELAWQWTMLAVLCIWIADGGAYLVGKFMAGKVLGRHKLSPRLSPNKTVEGYVGGIILGSVITVIIGYFLGVPLLAVTIFALLSTVLGPMGDLGISMLKRVANVKDSGTVFGEHGGALDRIDSLLWSVVLAYYVALLF